MRVLLLSLVVLLARCPDLLAQTADKQPPAAKAKPGDSTQVKPVQPRFGDDMPLVKPDTKSEMPVQKYTGEAARMPNAIKEQTFPRDSTRH